MSENSLNSYMQEQHLIYFYLTLFLIKRIYINFSEYARHFEIDENVAVIVCGENTRFQRHFSNRYEDIKHCLGKFEYIFII